jgi:hypothetical protein
MEQLLFKGSNRPTIPIPKECRIADLDEAIKFRNHKGASSQPELLWELMKGNVIHGYALPLPQQNQENTKHLHGPIEYLSSVNYK